MLGSMFWSLSFVNSHFGFGECNLVFWVKIGVCVDSVDTWGLSLNGGNTGPYIGLAGPLVNFPYFGNSNSGRLREHGGFP